MFTSSFNDVFSIFLFFMLSPSTYCWVIYLILWSTHSSSHKSFLILPIPRIDRSDFVISLRLACRMGSECIALTISGQMDYQQFSVLGESAPLGMINVHDFYSYLVSPMGIIQNNANGSKNAHRTENLIVFNTISK